MLTCWWDCHNIIHHELLPCNSTVTEATYIYQQHRFHSALPVKHPALLNQHGVVCHQDNTHPHVALKTQQKLHVLNWEILSHPPYSSDIAPSDFHLFQLSHFLARKSFSTDDKVTQCLDDFFMSCSADFY